MTEARPSNTFYVVHDLARFLRRYFAEVAREHGLTLTQWRALGALAHDDGLSQSALAARIDSDPMTLSTMIERLEARGLVRREADPEDSRAKIVWLTEQAHGLVGDMRALAEKAQAKAFAGISSSERETAIRVLARMRDNLEAPEFERQKA